MRIFYASDTTPNAAFKSNLWRDNLLLPLIDLKHDVVEFNLDLRETFLHLDAAVPEHRKFIERNRPRISAELLRQLRAAHAIKPLDLFFSYFYDACVLPATIDEIRAMGITTVNWYCNGSYQLHLVSEIAPHYDWCLVPEKFRLKDYYAMGAHPIYCQEAANPNIYKPYDVPVEFDVAFIGQCYGERPDYIRHLCREGIDARVWGYGWRETFGGGSSRPPETPASRARRIAGKLLTPQGRQAVANRLRGITPHRAAASSAAAPAPHLGMPLSILGGSLSDAEMIRTYSRAKINLGFSGCGETHRTGERIVQVRLRDFEVPMSGGFYMVEYMEELEEFYDIGREIVCYSGPQDLADKIKYFLEHDEERETIRQAGHARCLRDHTWHKRFQSAFAQMGLK